MDDNELRSCPFCGAGETQIRDQTVWTGQRSVVTSVEIHHWCEPQSTQLRSHLRVVGKTREEAIEAWEGQKVRQPAACETEKQKARKAEMHQLRLDSWNACIGAGGSPIEGWSSSPPAMRRCDYPPQQEGGVMTFDEFWKHYVGGDKDKSLETGRIYAASAWDYQQARIEALEAEVQAYRDIRSDSTGVAGYYPNGDSALWDEFDIPEQEGE